MAKNISLTKVAIIIPAYNEAKVIGGVIEGVNTVLNGGNIDYEIVLVDDGSTDGTSDVARRGGAYVISHVLNSGSGSATATGLSYAQQNGFDIAATLDGDGQHSPGDLLTGIEKMYSSKHDLLIGSRLIDSRGMSKSKVLGNKGLSLATYLIFGVHVTDSQSGLRIFSRKALDNLKWKSSGYEFCSEMLWRAKQLNLSISEYPIKAIYTDYSKNKGQNNWNSVNILKSLIQRRVMEVFGE